MGSFFDALRNGANAFRDDMGPGSYRVAGREVRCGHCGGQEFAHGHALMNSVGRTMVNLDWTDPSAHTLICGECSQVQWFVQEPDRVG